MPHPAYLILLAATLALLVVVLIGYKRINRMLNELSDDLQAAARAAIGPARKVLVGVLGVTVLLIGVALIVLPGPAFVVIPLGLAILSTEFLWARRLLKRIQDQIRNAGAAWRNRRQ